MFITWTQIHHALRVESVLERVNDIKLADTQFSIPDNQELRDRIPIISRQIFYNELDLATYKYLYSAKSSLRYQIWRIMRNHNLRAIITDSPICH